MRRRKGRSGRGNVGRRDEKIEEELCFGFIAKELYIVDYINDYFFSLKRSKIRLTLDTLLLRPHCCQRLGLLANNYERH